MASNRAQNALNSQVHGELKVGKLYFLNKSSILGFLKIVKFPIQSRIVPLFCTFSHYKLFYTGELFAAFSLEIASNRAQNAHNTQVHSELKVGKLYFHNKSSVLGFLKIGKFPNTYLLLAECEVRAASYGPVFPSFYDENKEGKNEDP